MDRTRETATSRLTLLTRATFPLTVRQLPDLSRHPMGPPVRTGGPIALPLPGQETAAWRHLAHFIHSSPVTWPVSFLSEEHLASDDFISRPWRRSC
jgi:hypothetical protein